MINCFVINKNVILFVTVSNTPAKAVKADVSVKKASKKIKKEEAASKVKTENGEFPM